MDVANLTPRSPTIAIVEDDTSLLGALTFALEADGFEVLGHSAGMSFLAAPRPVDCMIVDMRLPDTDGLTLISRLREKGVWAPAILVTTNPDARIRRTAESLGVQIVEKPLISGELRRRIDELIAANSH